MASGGQWRFPKSGLYTQAKRLDHIATEVKDALALLTGEPEDSFEVELTVRLDGTMQDIVQAAYEASVKAAKSQAAAAS